MVVNIALALIGGVLLFITIRRVGWAEVQTGLAQIGWWFLVVLILGGLRFAARARAWMACVDAVADSRLLPGPSAMAPRLAEAGPDAQRPPGTQQRIAGPPDETLGASSPAPGSADHRYLAPSTRHFWGASLAADALGNLTPFGLFASEPAKILLIRDRLPAVTAIVSVAAENAFYIASVVAMVAAGAALFIGQVDLPAGLRLGVQAVLIGAVASGVMAVLVARHKPAVLSRLARILSSLTGRARASASHLEEVEAHFYGILRWRARRVARIVAWHAAFHVAAVAEVLLVMRLLPGGQSTSLTDAFVLETAGRLIAVTFKFVPYRLGVDEAGTALVADALALGPTVGVALALVRRLRIFFWNAIGLIVLARSR
jgi:glycosyltransferase 2 family protein